MRRAFVVTVAVVSACTPPRTRKVGPSMEPGKSVSSLDYRKLKHLNPIIDHRAVQARGDRCFVQVPSGEKANSWQPPKLKQIDCPPEMDDPAWDRCYGGNLYKHVDTGACVCTRDGNPPPPPIETDCPG